ncbi:MAG: PEP-CTERM sorting domain-containing protein [Komarekiella atlantica HA4396-MV6]|jgi:hypothetical protein|nr:PEP-CTERM sorting domain-containing protein [Komarekiella atlantica HA4396-MV6]
MKFSAFIKHSTFKLGLLSLASFGITISTTSANAIQLDFSNWQQFGDVTTPALGQANLSNNALLDDDFPQPDATFNYSGNPAGLANPLPDLQDFLGLVPEALDIEGDALEGSAIKNTVSVAAGDVLRFDWNFRTNETSYQDYAFFLVDNTLIKLADFTDATQASSPFSRETGINSYAFSQPATYTLAFGVVDIDDYVATSALEVRNATIERVPEPGTLLGSLAVFGLSMGMRRRFGKKLGASK